MIAWLTRPAANGRNAVAVPFMALAVAVAPSESGTCSSRWTAFSAGERHDRTSATVDRDEGRGDRRGTRGDFGVSGATRQVFGAT